jgi:hypothetical protein
MGYTRQQEGRNSISMPYCRSYISGSDGFPNDKIELVE